MIRRLLFQIHMWIGLILGVLFVVLGLSGSILVYNDEIDRLGTPRATAIGAPASLDSVVAAARGIASASSNNVFLKLPKMPGDPVLVRFLPAARTYFVDPVTARPLGSRPAPLSALLQATDELHGNLFAGTTGRLIVGWLGIGMTVLGLTGLVLWWPRARQWKYAFIVRRTAKGLRFHRELHGAAGIWGLAVFVVVSVTGVSMVFADDLRAMVTERRTASPMRGPDITATGNAQLGIQSSVDLARKALPAEHARSVVVRNGAAISVAMSGDDAPMLTLVYVDPYRAKVIAIRDPYQLTGVEEYVAWQKPLHIAEGIGPLWRTLVFVSGFLPLVFFVTGVTMWLQKRRNRMAMTRPLPQA